MTRGAAARRGGTARRRAARPRRRAGRPRRRIPAEHSRGDRGVPRLRLDRGDLVELLAGLRRQKRDRPLRADRAARPAHRRRLPLRGQGLRPNRSREGAARGAADGRAHGRARLPRPRPAARRARRSASPGASFAGGRRSRRSSFEQVPFGPSALGALQLGHDRPAEGDRARPRGDPARDAEDDEPPPRPAGRRSAVLVHDDRLDDVELRRRRCLTTEASIVLYDGNPGTPDLGVLWDLAEAAGVTCFGTGAAYIGACQKAGLRPAAGQGSLRTAVGRVDRLAALVRRASPGSTTRSTTTCGSSPPPAAPMSAPRSSAASRPCRSTRASCRPASLGARLEAWSPDGKPLVGEVGELVLTEPMPSMPLFFWGDADGSRYRESYFEMFPGVWRHGDWIEITDRGTAIISGRSDATINRGGDPDGHERDLPGGAHSRRGRGRTRARSAPPGHGRLHAALRRAARRDEPRRRARAIGSAAGSARTARRGTFRTSSSRSPRCRERSPARCWSSQ